MDQKENQPLELEELDLALPDDLSAGSDFASPGSGIDDLDLDLPELSTEDDSDSLSLAAEPAGMDLPDMPDLPQAEAAPVSDSMDLDEEPIALSEEELERIMGGSDSTLSNDFADAQEEPLAEPQDMDLAAEPLGGDVPDLDLAMDMDTDLSPGFGAGAEAPLPEMDMDFADMHSDLEDEGPVALSEEELGSIMGDVSEHMDAPESGPDDSLLEPDFGDEHADMHETMPDAPAAMGAGMEGDEDDNITLSDDELNNILLDASDLEPARSVPEPAEAPRLAEMGLDDEDEPIALTAEELGNIISDVSEVSDAEEQDSLAMAPALLDEEDEGPLALSDDELNSILEDVHEEPADAPTGESPRNLIVLDDYEDREKAEETSGREAAIDRAALSSGVDKTELKKMIGYLDQLFDKLPEDTIREFSSSEYFDLYKRIMQDLGLS